MSDNEWYNDWQQITPSEWYSAWQRMITSDKELQWAAISDNFPIFLIRDEPTTKHPKENTLNLEEELKVDLFN